MGIILNDIKIDMENCKKCRLCKGRINVIVGDGTPCAPVMLIGEAPGAQEEITGIPFIGRSGKLLMQMLDEIGISRKKNLYITNTLKCRPPENRNPKADETKACKPFLDRQIEAHNPKVIITVGNYATKYFLGKNVAITNVHGQFFNIDNKNIFPVFHPAALLRQQRLKPLAIEDFNRLKEYLISNNIL